MITTKLTSENEDDAIICYQTLKGQKEWDLQSSENKK